MNQHSRVVLSVPVVLLVAGLFSACGSVGVNVHLYMRSMDTLANSDVPTEEKSRALGESVALMMRVRRITRITIPVGILAALGGAILLIAARARSRGKEDPPE
ncbi:MAG: hypothetical protein HS104_03140 [Polyangiaceae bacterium]|nr:hypothetical protein [Polyangiaceae bacterium]